MSKAIVINIPTTFKEVKGRIKDVFKTMSHPYRRSHNARVIQNLEDHIFYELNSNYWAKDISDYARETLTNTTNGKLHTMICEAFRALK